MRLAKGDTIGIQGCNEATGPETSARITFSLLLGTIWAHVTKAVGGTGAHEVNTPGHANGVRGTIFWITSTATATILHVDKDSMWTAALKGTQVYGKKWIVTAGHTATWKQGATSPSSAEADRPPRQGSPRSAPADHTPDPARQAHCRLHRDDQQLLKPRSLGFRFGKRKQQPSLSPTDATAPACCGSAPPTLLLVARRDNARWRRHGSGQWEPG